MQQRSKQIQERSDHRQCQLNDQLAESVKVEDMKAAWYGDSGHCHMQLPCTKLGSKSFIDQDFFTQLAAHLPAGAGKLSMQTCSKK